jgi:ribonuclease P protein component
MFAKKNRLRKKVDFDKVFRYGKAIHSDLFILKILPNNLNYNRFAVIVSKKISTKAVERNRIKRILRELLKNSSNPLFQNVDAIIYTKKTIVNKKYSEIKNSFNF